MKARTLPSQVGNKEERLCADDILVAECVGHQVHVTKVKGGN